MRLGAAGVAAQRISGGKPGIGRIDPFVLSYSVGSASLLEQRYRLVDMGLQQFCHPDPLVIRAQKRIHRVEANCPFLERSDLGDCTRHQLTSAKQSIGVGRITIERDHHFVLADRVLAIALRLQNFSL